MTPMAGIDANTALANRAAFRTLLRAGSHLPALQRKMFGPTHRSFARESRRC